MDVIETARIWRERIEKVGCGGVVVVYEGDAQGWVRILRNPEHWVPGCVAVAEDGRTWTTLGGNSKHGALMWLPNFPIPD